jgi:hypothetical protein
MVLCFIAALERGFVRVLRTNAGQRVVLSPDGCHPPVVADSTPLSSVCQTRMAASLEEPPEIDMRSTNDVDSPQVGDSRREQGLYTEGHPLGRRAVISLGGPSERTA